MSTAPSDANPDAPNEPTVDEGLPNGPGPTVRAIARPTWPLKAVSGLRLLASIGLLAAGLASCGHATTSGRSTLATSSPGSPAETRVVGLGDSVAAAAGCACTSFVQLLGDDVRRHTGRPNHTDNFARNGLDTAGLLAQLKDPAVATAVAHADLVTVTIGANDFGTAESDYFAGTCGGSDGLDCFRTTLPTLHANLTAVLDRIKTLAAGHPVGVRVTNYWNVFEDGEVAQENHGDAFVRDSNQLTREANAVICDAAHRAGDLCVDLDTAFNRASPGGDPTSLLAPDGDHPDQAGQDLIAATVAAAGYAPLR
jgi:lysophospholipase L1-like esterase